MTGDHDRAAYSQLSTQEAAALGAGIATGIVVFTAVGMMLNLPDMAVLGAVVVFSALAGLYLGGGHHA